MHSSFNYLAVKNTKFDKKNVFLNSRFPSTPIGLHKVMSVLSLVERLAEDIRKFCRTVVHSMIVGQKGNKILINQDLLYFFLGWFGRRQWAAFCCWRLRWNNLLENDRSLRQRG